MCTKNVERVLDFNHEIKRLYEINLEDDLRYVKSDIGINANGFIYVIGKYDDGEGIRDFEELLEVDILAPFEKIEDENSFKIGIDDYDYHVLHGDLLLEIVLRIYGLLDENKKGDEESSDYIEIIKNDESIKNENMDSIEEKIDEFMHVHDSEALTADKLTSIINKVIHDNKEEKNEDIDVVVNTEVNEDIINTNEDVSIEDEADLSVSYVEPYIGENMYREEYTDHALGFREEIGGFIENVLEDALSDELVDHIANMREVSLLIEDTSESSRDTCDCVESCTISNLEEESFLKDFNPKFEPSYDHFAFYSNKVKEYELQHDKCESMKNLLKGEEEVYMFDFPLYKEEIELFSFPIFDGGEFMRKEYDLDSFDELNDYDLDDFMGDLDLLEQEMDELPEITLPVEEYRIIEKSTKCENVNADKVDDNKVVEPNNTMMFEDILDDSVNRKTTMRYVLIRDGDTYYSLSMKYGVDERVIAKHNNFKVLERGCVIEIPLG